MAMLALGLVSGFPDAYINPSTRPSSSFSLLSSFLSTLFRVPQDDSSNPLVKQPVHRQSFSVATAVRSSLLPFLQSRIAIECDRPSSCPRSLFFPSSSPCRSSAQRACEELRLIRVIRQLTTRFVAAVLSLHALNPNVGMSLAMRQIHRTPDNLPHLSWTVERAVAVGHVFPSAMNNTGDSALVEMTQKKNKKPAGAANTGPRALTAPGVSKQASLPDSATSANVGPIAPKTPEGQIMGKSLFPPAVLLLIFLICFVFIALSSHRFLFLCRPAFSFSNALAVTLLLSPQIFVCWPN